MPVYFISALLSQAVASKAKLASSAGQMRTWSHCLIVEKIPVIHDPIHIPLIDHNAAGPQTGTFVEHMLTFLVLLLSHDDQCMVAPAPPSD